MARVKNLGRVSEHRHGTRLSRAQRSPQEAVSGRPAETSQSQKAAQRPTPKKSPRKRRQYSANRMCLAIADLRERIKENPAENKSAVAAKYDVPRTTLIKKVANKLPDTPVPLGRKPTLPAAAEDELVGLLRCAALKGYPLTVDEVREMVFHYCKTYKVPNCFSDKSEKAGKKWWRLFKRRHPELTVKKAENLSRARALGMNKEKVMTWFDDLRKVFDMADVWANAHLVWNMDESAVITVPNAKGLVISFKDIRCQSKIVSAERGTLTTLIAACSASGQFVPPMLIMRGKRINPEWLVDVPAGTCIEVTDSGWSDREMFFKWMQHFVAHKPPIPEGKKLVLILDGHGSHGNLPALKLARDENIEVLCLPPHTTNHLQPLDKCVFGPFKASWESVCDNYIKNHRTETKGVITLAKVPKLFTRSWNKSAKANNAISGFEHTGIYPFNPNRVPNEAYLLGNTDDSDVDVGARDDNSDACEDMERHVSLFSEDNDQPDGHRTPVYSLKPASSVCVVERDITDVSDFAILSGPEVCINAPVDSYQWVGNEVVIPAYSASEVTERGEFTNLVQMRPEPQQVQHAHTVEAGSSATHFGFQSIVADAQSSPSPTPLPAANSAALLSPTELSSNGDTPPPSITRFFRATMLPQHDSNAKNRTPPSTNASADRRYHMTSPDYIDALEHRQRKQAKSKTKRPAAAKKRASDGVRRSLPTPGSSSSAKSRPPNKDGGNSFEPCPVCEHIYKVGANWIKCDDCDRWQHDTCAGKATKRYFFCLACSLGN